MLQTQFLVFHRDHEELLRLLKKAGVVHIKRRRKEDDAAFVALRRKAVENKRTQAEWLRRLPREEPDALPLPDFKPTETAALLREMDEAERQLARLDEDAFHYRQLGQYDADKLATLQKRGLYVHLFSTPLGRMNDDWATEHAVEHLFDAGRKTWFAVFSDKPQRPNIAAQPENFPEQSLDEIEQTITSLRHDLERRQSTLFHDKDLLAHWFDQAALRSEDALQDERAQLQSQRLGFGKVILLEGWVPEENMPALQEALDRVGFYHEAAPAKAQDSPPIALRNGRFGKLFEPIAKLFALPQYAELDLTPFFAPFFFLFFGLCLGDGGYGLLAFIVLLAVRPRIPSEYRGIWALALVLEAGAAILGILSGTFFGINLLEAPWPWLTRFRTVMLDANQLFTLSLILGATQIAFGLILQAINGYRQFGWAHAIAPVGWLFLLAGLGAGYLDSFTLPVQITTYVGLALVLWFSAPGDGVGARLGKGVWALYGITGVFGDLLSYVRLFALGLAGSILGFVVNDIALSILPSHKIFGVVGFIILLIVGHGLNIFIATLGAFVHPMRLTFVEFYKNAGFAGGGEAYQPLVHLPIDQEEELDSATAEDENEKQAAKAEQTALA